MPHRRKSLSQTQLLGLVDLIYQTALAPDTSSLLLEGLGTALRGRTSWHACLRVTGQGPSYRFNRIWNAKDAVVADACCRAQPSPWTEAASSRPPGAVWRTSQLLPLSELARHDFYHDFVAPLEIHHCIGVQDLLDDGEIAIHTVYRPQRDGDFTDAEVQLFQLLAPHLRRAAIVSVRIGQIEAERTAALETLHRLTIGVILLDRRGEPVFINHSAEELLAAADGLCLVDGELHAWLDAETRALARLMQNAAGAETVDAGGELSITRPSGQRPLGVLVAPLRPEGLLPGARPPTAVVFLTDPEQRTEGREAGLTRLFGLTPAEATVAVEVARGGGLQEVADSLSVSLNTVRSQLAQVLAKTQTRRQAELVRLLAGGIAQVRPPATTRRRQRSEP